MNITQFAKSHNIKYENVSMFISRHKKMFEGHISTVGKFRYLDDKAIEILEKQYPPIISHYHNEKNEFKDKYLESLEHIKCLQNELLKIQNELSDYRSKKLLIETQADKIKHFEALVKEYRNDIEYLKQQCANLQSRSFFDFLFRRNKKGKTLNENHSAF